MRSFIAATEGKTWYVYAAAPGSWRQLWDSRRCRLLHSACEVQQYVPVLEIASFDALVHLKAYFQQFSYFDSFWHLWIISSCTPHKFATHEKRENNFLKSIGQKTVCNSSFVAYLRGSMLRAPR